MEPKKAVSPWVIPLVIALIAGYVFGVMYAGALSLAGTAAALTSMAAAIALVRMSLGTDVRASLKYGALLGVGWNAGFFLHHALSIMRVVGKAS
ncbi:MAG TPA: hypothetical protein VLC10_04265 [Patescibacteria group bacterium]|nr:hypothetical protein [Patescibacteria group bacterium]